MGAWDRVKESFFGAVRASNPRVDYMCAYRGTVVSQSGQAVDVKLDDARLPGMAALPLQPGIPGATIEVFAGARVLVAFENGDPAKPVALLWDQGAHVGRVSLPADLLELGAEGATEANVLGSTYRGREASLNGSLATSLTTASVELLAAGAAGSHGAAQPHFIAAGTALAAAVAALRAFEAGASSYLSTVVRTA